jgi:hypothetical protein
MSYKAEGGTPSIETTMTDRRYLGRWFEGESWAAWLAVLKAAFAEPMTAAEVELFRKVAGGRDPPGQPVKELWCAVGRGGGKDAAASLIATHTALFVDHRRRLRPGQRATTLCLACDRDQAKIALSYVRGYFTEHPVLKGTVERETQFGLELKNRSEIIVKTNNFRSVRGLSCACVILDECAFYRDDTSANPDREVYVALQPALARMPGSILVGISSPYRQSGLLFDKYREHFGKAGDDVLIIQAPTLVMNSTFPQAEVDRAYRDDPISASAEYGAEFRSDVGAFLDRELVESLVEPGRMYRPPIPGVRYVGFVDPSGARHDSFTAAVAHADEGRMVLDLICEYRPKFSPPQVIKEIASRFKQYRISNVWGDNWGAQLTVDMFAREGITYNRSKQDASEIYVSVLGLFTSGQVALLDHPQLVAQLSSLERRPGSSGHDKICHPARGHDDLANSACGALLRAMKGAAQKPTNAAACPVLIPVSGFDSMGMPMTPLRMMSGRPH